MDVAAQLLAGPLILLMHSSLLQRPYPRPPPRSHSPNIFDAPLLPPSLQPTARDFHFVGPPQIRERILMERVVSRPLAESNLGESLPELGRAKSQLSTIQRSSVLSKLAGREQELTRERRIMQKFKERRQEWEQMSLKLRRGAGKSLGKEGQLSLLETDEGKLRVVPNPEKTDILQQYVNSYWEMSLRNNSIALKRHLRGSVQEGQLDQMLQSQEGQKQLESSLPRLPLEKLSKLTTAELTLTGRPKRPTEGSVLASRRYSRDPEPEILRLEYDSAHQWLKESTQY